NMDSLIRFEYWAAENRGSFSRFALQNGAAPTASEEASLFLRDPAKWPTVCQRYQLKINATFAFQHAKRQFVPSTADAVAASLQNLDDFQAILRDAVGRNT